MRLAAKCPESLWDEFYLTAAHLHAKTATKSLQGRIPFELWYKRVPNYMYIREIGCCAFVLTLDHHNPKLNACGIECILVGYGQNSKSYRCYDPKTKQIHELYHVHFLEWHKEHASTNCVKTTAEKDRIDKLTSIEQITAISTPTPLLTNNDDDITSHPAPNTADNDHKCPHDEVPPIVNQGPCRSSRVPTPTVKAMGDNLPTTRLEHAVQDSREAGNCVKA